MRNRDLNRFVLSIRIIHVETVLDAFDPVAVILSLFVVLELSLAEN